jgi:hypothetical protein
MDPRLRGDGVLRNYYEYHRSLGMIDTIDASRPVIEQWLTGNAARKAVPGAYLEFDRSYEELLAFLVT